MNANCRFETYRIPAQGSGKDRMTSPDRGSYELPLVGKIRVRDSGELRAWLTHCLEEDSGSVSRVLYLTEDLSLIALDRLPEQRAYSELSDLLSIFERARTLNAVGLILIDHLETGKLAASRDLDLVTILLRRFGDSQGIHLLDHFIVSDEGWFSQAFQRHLQ